MRNFNTLDCDIKSCDCSYLHIHAVTLQNQNEGHAITLTEKKMLSTQLSSEMECLLSNLYSFQQSKIVKNQQKCNFLALK